MQSTTLALAVTFATSLAGIASAQKAAVGVEAGEFRAFEESLLQLGLRVAPPRGGVAGVDFTFATFPDLLSNGTLLFLMDLGATQGVPRDSSPVFFFPHGGITLLTAGNISGGGGGGAAVGVSFGAGLLVPASTHVGIRFDYTYRRFIDPDTPSSSITFSLMFLR